MKYILPLLLLVSLGACTLAQENQSGHMIRASAVEELKAGQKSKDDVLRLLGTPSSRSTFGPETWYYIATTTENLAFIQNEVKQRQVVEVSFDEFGVMSNMASFTEKDGREVLYAKKVTPTEGNKLGFVQQLIGNVGRFNKEAVEK